MIVLGNVTVTLLTLKILYLTLTFFLEVFVEKNDNDGYMGQFIDKNMDSSDILDIYFNEAGQYPLLTRSEETELLAKYIKYRDNKGKCSSLQRKKALEARERLINCNLRLVIKIAKDYQKMGLDLLD